jgi:LytS/YehU family sensor histidine kinase
LHNRPNEAGIYLSQFARLIRQNLSAIDTSMINLEEEIDHLKNYLDLEKLRMGDKFVYTIEIDDNVEYEEMLIPSMIIQPFVENAIWHGIANLDENGFLSIVFKLDSDKSLQIIIEDSGVGIKNAAKYSTKGENHLKLGMNITRKRLHLLGQKYGVETSFVYSERSPGTTNPGTRVVIIVPFLYGRPESNS